MSNFDNLQSQITGDTWLDKDFLIIHNSVFSAINNGQNWLLSQAPVQAIMSNPAMTILIDIISSIKNISDSVRACGLILCETAYGINKAVNSRVHKDLAGVGNFMLSRLSPQESLYKAAIVAHNETLNLPELSKGKIPIGNLPPCVGNPLAELKQLVDENLNKLTELRDGLGIQIAQLTGAAKAKAQRTKNRIQSIINRIINRNKSASKSTPKSASKLFLKGFAKGPIAIIPVGNATISGTIAIVTTISSFLLKIFTAGAISGGMFEALAKATTSIVLKFIGSSGAIAARYFAASVFKSVIASLPAIIGATATFAGSWAFLMVFAPAIILAAVITAEAIKNKVKLGELLYIFGLEKKLLTKPDKGFVVLSRTNRVEMQDEMINMAQSMIDESGKDYKVLIGIAVDRKSLEPVLAVDMVKIKEPVRYARKEDLIRVSAPWTQEILDANDPDKPPF